MTNLINTLPDDISSEFYVESDGKVLAKSVRAVARLAGVHHSSVQELIERLGGGLTTSNSLKAFTGKDFTGGQPIPDLLVAAIIEYYAFESKADSDHARKVYRAFATVGFRTYMQQQLGWNNKPLDFNSLMGGMQLLMDKVNQLEIR